jgi:hypothetical protein
MTPLAEEVARLHRSATGTGTDGLPVDGICAVCEDEPWPCPTLLLAREVLESRAHADEAVREFAKELLATENTAEVLNRLHRTLESKKDE